MRGPELRELRREYPESSYLFATGRGGPMMPATVRKLIARAGALAKLPFPIRPHLLRHSVGYKLASEGQDTRCIEQNTSGTGTSCTRCAIRSSARIASRNFGRIDSAPQSTSIENLYCGVAVT